MSQLDALRAALEKVKRGLPVSTSPAIAPREGEHWGTFAGLIGGRIKGHAELWYADADHCADIEDNAALGVSSDNMAQALALSVNLAPWLLAVAEAARRLHDLLEDAVRGPESAGIDLACSTGPLAEELRDALQGLQDALRAADGKEIVPWTS